MNIIPFEQCHVREAAQLLWDAYQAERAAVPALPESDGANFFARLAGPLAGNGLGIASITDGRLTGFLTGMAVGELFGTSRGVYVPVHAHGVAGGDRLLAYQRLYEAASDIWVRKGLLSHVITLYAHDDTAVSAWFRQNFGLRCVDAVRTLADIQTGRNAGCDIRRVMPEDAERLADLHKEHWAYYRSAPMFMQVNEDCSAGALRAWLAQKDQYAWAAFEGDTPAAYMLLRHGGETFASDDEKSMNICGAYVKNGLRNTGYGAAILQTVVNWLRENCFERLGVDYESFNIPGCRFWQKHFTPFTLSLTRRIDERAARIE